MKIYDIFASHLAAYPRMKAQDFCKLCYQAEFGGGHLLNDPEAALIRLTSEYNSVSPSDEPLFADVGGGHVRISLAAARAQGIAPEVVFSVFKASAAVCGSTDGFNLRAAEALAFVRENAPGFTVQELESSFDELRKSDYMPISHSEDYRRLYSPAYRIIDIRYAPLISLIMCVNESLTLIDSVDGTGNKPLVIVIDGMAGSGKSTAAELLARLWSCAIVHTDDFFLPPELRTPERFAVPGGNIHYERLRDEVTDRIRSLPLSYRVFDCSRMDYNGSRTLTDAPVVIVEGSYSQHPELWNYYDIGVFLRINPEEQLRRITERSGVESVEMFRNRWIPFEQAYFYAFDISGRSRFAIETDTHAVFF